MFNLKKLAYLVATALMVPYAAITLPASAEGLSAIEAAIMQQEQPKTPKQAAAAFKRELAVGPFQIRPILVADLKRIGIIDPATGRAFKHGDALRLDKSLAMFRAYTTYWAWKRGDQSDEFKARCWNGGPTFNSKTDAYWASIKERLKQS